MQQLAERLSPVSSGLVNSSRGFATSTIRRSDEDKVFKLNHWPVVCVLCPL